jgi:hypothetical protein
MESYNIYTLNPDFAVGCKICTDATVGIYSPKGQALWPDSDRSVMSRSFAQKAKFGVNLMTFQSQRDQYASRLTKMRSILRQP